MTDPHREYLAVQRVGIGVQSLGLFSSEVEWFAELVPGVHDVSVLGVEDLHRELCTGFQAFDRCWMRRAGPADAS